MASCCRWLNQPASALRTTRAKATSTMAPVYLADRNSSREVVRPYRGTLRVRDDGTVKVLDFGLAKAMDPASPSSANAMNSPTLTAATVHGVILGTAAYMSPEQAAGKPVDKRSDLWAFGVVLLEMLTGRQMFTGETVSHVLAAVLATGPDWTKLPPDTPAPIRTLLRRCLEKDRKQRLDSAAAVRLDIDDALVGTATPGGFGGIVARSPWRRALPFAATAIVAVVFTGIAVWSVRPSTPAPTVTRFSFPLAEGQQFTNGGRPLVALSPDGTQMVYVANNRLYLRSMSETEARLIPGTEEPSVTSPAFSPDGRSIAFVSGREGAVKRIAVGGGVAITLCPISTTSLGLSWGADGIVFGQRGVGIMRVSSNGGQPELLVSVKNDEVAFGPHVLPGGQAVLFTLVSGAGTGVGTGNSDPGDMWDKAHIVVQSLTSAERKTLITGGSDAQYVPTDHLVYAVGGVLFAVTFDLRRLQVVGGPVPIVQGVRRGAATGAANFGVSANGSLIYVPGPVSTRQRDLALIDRLGSPQPLKLQGGLYEYPRVSPDGQRVAVETDDGKDANIWIYDLTATSSLRRLTLAGRNEFPVWSADSARVAFQSNREGDLAIFWQRADGSGTAERLTKPDPDTTHVPSSWSPDGKRLLFTERKGSNTSLWTLSLPDKAAARVSDVQSPNDTDGAFSPDGRWVAYTSVSIGTRGAESSVVVQPFPSTGAKYFVSSEFSAHPVWSSDGKELFFSGGGPGQLRVVRVTTHPSFVFGDRTPVSSVLRAIDRGPFSPRNYDITPDAKRFIGVVVSGQAQTGESAAPQIQVVLNWLEELKRLAPTK